MLFDVSRSHEPSEPSVTPTISEESPSSQVVTTISEVHSTLFENDNITPRTKVLFPLLDVYFDRFSCHFPFLEKTRFMASVRAKKISAVLLNSMCALAARFSDLPDLQGKKEYQRGDVFGNRAQMLLVPLLNLPSQEVVASILMVAWHELAINHDVGIWMYTGMACRMAVDLGLEKVCPGSRQNRIIDLSTLHPLLTIHVRGRRAASRSSPKP